MKNHDLLILVFFFHVVWRVFNVQSECFNKKSTEQIFEFNTGKESFRNQIPRNEKEDKLKLSSD